MCTYLVDVSLGLRRCFYVVDIPQVRPSDDQVNVDGPLLLEVCLVSNEDARKVFTARVHSDDLFSADNNHLDTLDGFSFLANNELFA